MLITYANSSPYYTTSITDGYLSTWNYRSIPIEADDILFELDSKYQYRPDLLAYDLYNNVSLWWVFAVRNPNIIKDPVIDMVPGVKIYLPKISVIKKALGI